MYQLIFDIINSFEFGKYSQIIANTGYILFVIIVCLILRSVSAFILTKFSARINDSGKGISVLFDKKLLIRLSNFIIPLAVAFLTSELRGGHILLGKVVDVSLVISGAFVLSSLISGVGRVCASHAVSKTFPVRGVLQVAEIAMFIIFAIIAVSIIVEKSPIVLLGSIGAMTAVTTIVFKDAILGFVAGIQLTGNDMIRIGDWIEIPKHSANGTVIDLSLTTVKVQNFDNSISQIPAYTLISESFINWRGMLDAGARRIKRPIYIDASSIQVCDDILRERLGDMPLLYEFFDFKLAELEKERGGSVTNIEVLRAYIVEYLTNHPGIRKDLTLMVRQLDMSEKGIPLEIYAFADTMNWLAYEDIQTGIFDHLYAQIPKFGLILYQSPSSGDLRGISCLYKGHNP